jgi:tRNA nucleotidyltransferase/poly(A) polymerase
MKDKMNELATKSKNNNIRDLYRGLNDLKIKVTNPEVT